MQIVIISDLHVGSAVGLTPSPQNAVQKGLIERYEDCIKHLGKPDLLIVNGDATDGLQIKGGMRDDDDWIPSQIDHAAQLVSMWKAKEVFVVGGTPYHVSAMSGKVDFEEILAHRIRAKFQNKLDMVLGGWFRLMCRHKIGSSSIPHGRFTPQARSRMWSILNSAVDGERPPHLSIFSHVHFFSYCEDFMGASMTTPAWSALGSAFGDSLDGHCDVGAVKITVKGKDDWRWEKRLYKAAVVDRRVSR